MENAFFIFSKILHFKGVQRHLQVWSKGLMSVCVSSEASCETSEPSLFVYAPSGKISSALSAHFSTFYIIFHFLFLPSSLFVLMA